MKAFVAHETSIDERLFNAVYMIFFLRIWKTDVVKRNLPSESFITSNCFEGLEINLLWLLKLITDNRAHNISENSSQQCESEFRHIRSMTGVQNTQINCTPKTLLSRLHKIEMCERIMFELKDKIVFPVLEQREKRHSRDVREIKTSDIHIIIESGMFAAIEKSKELGIHQEEITLKDLIGSVSNDDVLYEAPVSEPQHPRINSSSISEWDNDGEDEQVDASLVLQNVEFLNIESSKF